ncbi:MAG: hypothetical protein U9Q30_03055 [Campylobacterota bacterium]|nr:hypothetical protein [Campylobacterota bacterium]
MFNKLNNSLDYEIDELAKKIAIKKLSEQGIDYKLLKNSEFNELIKARKEILKKDVKQVGATAAVTIALTILTGGI